MSEVLQLLSTMNKNGGIWFSWNHDLIWCSLLFYFFLFVFWLCAGWLICNTSSGYNCSKCPDGYASNPLPDPFADDLCKKVFIKSRKSRVKAIIIGMHISSILYLSNDTHYKFFILNLILNNVSLIEWLLIFYKI